MLDTVREDEPLLHRQYFIPLFLALLAAGLAGNYFRYEIFFNIELIFGSIAAMLALQLFGLQWGVVAAAVISCSTYLIWNHPYAIVIMTAEVAVVGLLRARRGMGLVQADALYWVFVGIPLVILFYYGAMQLPFHIAAVTMMKQSVNGIANTLAARLIFMSAWSGGKKERVSLRELIFSLLALFALVPSLLLLSLQSRADLRRTETAVYTALRLDLQRTIPLIENWLQGRLAIVEHLAWMPSIHPLPLMQLELEHVRGANPDFLRMGLLDSSATIIAYSPVLDELGQKNIGKNFADRPFIPVLKQTLKPMLSEVVMGRIGTPKPMVTALAPVVKQGAYAGYVTGILDFEKVRQMIATNMKSASLPGVQFILLDRNRKVIVSSHTELKTLEPFLRAGGELVDQGEGISQWIPRGAKNVSVSNRWKEALYVAESRIGGQSAWTLILEQPMAPFQKQLYERYAVQLSWVFLILLAAISIAEMASRGFVRSLSEVNAISTDIPSRISSGAEIVWPESTIQETSALIGNFRAMSLTLARQFKVVQEMNAELERRVDERTQSLKEKTLQLESLTKTLEQRVDDEVALRVKNEQFIIQQSKLAAMGEMIGAIAHQWRQPLNALGLIVQNLKDAHAYGELDGQYLEQTVQKSMAQIRHMSDTIDDFRNFFLPDKEKTSFDAMHAVGNVLSLFSAQLTANNISYRLTCRTHGRVFENVAEIVPCPEKMVTGYRNEFEHVILNLVNNARDSILEKRERDNGPAEGFLSFDFSNRDGKVVLQVCDNGAGIDLRIVDRIFEPYFSTKTATKGTGMGLYMSKVIIEDHMGGTIVVAPGEQGAVFTVELPKADAGGHA